MKLEKYLHEQKEQTVLELILKSRIHLWDCKLFCLLAIGIANKK